MAGGGGASDRSSKQKAGSSSREEEFGVLNTMLRRLPRSLLGRAAARPLEARTGLFSTERGLAKKAAAAPKPKAQSGTNNDPAIVPGLNILKDGEEIKVKPDSEYPEWVFELHRPLQSLEQLSKRYEADPSSLSPQETKRLIRQWNRKRIKDTNDDKAK